MTIFQTSIPISPSIKSKLAQSCEWESVVISPGDALTFFMPSGDEVSFCAHAAMGAACVLSEISGDSDTIKFNTSDLCPQSAMVDRQSSGSINIGLFMDSVYHEKLVDAHSLLQLCSVKSEHVTSSLPIINASVARSKTLVRLVSVDALHNVSSPLDPEAFRIACDIIDSTGLYLYAESSDGFECRQFPRASGYPEDPATGIAAGALAVCLHPILKRQQYKIYQGTAMGRPSLIQIRNVKKMNDHRVTLECWGLVEIDSRDHMRI